MGRWRIRQVHHMPWTSGSGSSSGNGPWRKVGPVRISGPTNTKTLCELKANKGSLNTKWFQNLSFQSNSNFGKWKTYDYDWPVLHGELESIRHGTKDRPLEVSNSSQWMVSACSLLELLWIWKTETSNRGATLLKEKLNFRFLWWGQLVYIFATTILTVVERKNSEDWTENCFSWLNWLLHEKSNI